MIMADLEQTPSKPFRVLIVGAGFVGLSLSHAFQLAGIDHVVLEKHDKITSVRGAALIIWPGVARIFDQFGFLDQFIKSITPVSKEYRRWPDGSVNQICSTFPVLSRMFQTTPILTDRTTCITQLYENLPDKSKVHTGRKLCRIEHTSNGVHVHLSDGSIEEGDMVIGADGVHSHVRSEMWDYASKYDPSAIPQSDKSAMFSDYGGLVFTCLQEDSFGMDPTEAHIVFGHDATQLWFARDGKTHWNVIFRDEHSQPPKRRSASEASANILAQRFADLHFTEKLRFRDLWEKRIGFGLFNIEEGILDKWHAGRIVLVGDSAWKMTAELGMGANIAIEAAITLANILHRELKANPNRRFTQSELSGLFTEYQTDRFDRAKGYVKLSGQVTRGYSYQSLFSRFMVGYVGPWIQNSKLMQLAESLAEAPKLDYVPVRTMNEDAEGWQLAKKGEKSVAGARSWGAKVLLASVVGAAVAYAVSWGLLDRL
ncbi:hypothetical protein NX059_005763 [Plenodomus lindquistii]|nr:hypothetical protein NX059_005763 [Plenodomus lindquistii]